jgi:hypothetical protein
MSKLFVLFVLLAVLIMPSIVLADGPDEMCHEEPTEMPVEPTEMPNPGDDTSPPVDMPESTPIPVDSPGNDVQPTPVPTTPEPTIGVPVSEIPMPSHHDDNDDEDTPIIITVSTEIPIEYQEVPMILPETGGNPIPGYIYLALAGLVLMAFGIGLNTYVLVAIKRIK